MGLRYTATSPGFVGKFRHPILAKNFKKREVTNNGEILGHTIYYKVSIVRWEEFTTFLNRVVAGIGYSIMERKDTITIDPGCASIERLTIPRKGEGFVKTNLREPFHSIYLLILYSASSFGFVLVWED